MAGGVAGQIARRKLRANLAQMNKALKILLICFGGLIVLVATGLGWLAWELRPQPPDAEVPKLAQKLRGNFAEARMEFQHRLQVQFPAGSKESQLVKELKSERFDVHERSATFQQSRFPCAYHWYVSWQQQDGRIKDIKANYDAGCL